MSLGEYQPATIESNIQQHWDNDQTFVVTEDPSKEKFYSLAMFPYPSGNLHVGHVRNYTLSDVIARYQRMLGKNVLQPIGWDAFGLPAENAAIQRDIHPKDWTESNIAAMREQFKRLGFAYDWTRELATCDPDYFKWEQWLFTKLYEKGLAYKKDAWVNWDPIDQTVLANEQVVDGKGWRSGAPVEKKCISQWSIKITAYADELVDELDNLTGWPEQVRAMQRNWIGRSQGTEVDFNVVDHHTTLSVYTTRPDTLYGVSYLAVSAEHPLVAHVAAHNSNIQAFVSQCAQHTTMEAELATMEKCGMDTGLQAINPLTGKAIPIWVANYVLIDYGSGAVMAVPAHDARDHEFASKYDLPIMPVIAGDTDWDYSQAAYTDDGKLVNSGEFDGLTTKKAKHAITEHLASVDQGRPQKHYRLRDWGVSRQRYWGTPIPMLNNHGDTAAVPDSDLPVTLPYDVTFDGRGSPLAKHEGFLNTAIGTRDPDTFDTFVESSWYFVRYCCPDADAMADDRAKYWLPVDHYVGGIEHACMHLLYARLFFKIMRDIGLIDGNEPFKNLLTQGMVLKDGAKMSKSKGNTVDPNALIDQYGADTLRLFVIFAAPPEQSLEWSDTGVEGAHRFLRKVWQLTAKHEAILKQQPTLNIAALSKADKTLRFELHTTLKQINFDMQRQQFNTVVSGAMKLLNTLNDANSISDALLFEGITMLLRVLAPIAPHMTHHLWAQLGLGKDVSVAPWPQADEQALVKDTIEMILQVNGKMRGKMEVAANADKDSIEAAALANDNVQRFIDDKTVRKIIVVPGKLVNVVAA